jgi:arsenite-transporting ATPase
MTRLVLLAGKGGVGKTTVSAATAVEAARRGQRTLVASLDRAHNLCAVLGAAPSSTPAAVPGVPGLAVVESDPQVELRDQWDIVRDTFGRLLTWLGASAVDADAIAVLPGLEELLVLSRLTQLADSGDHDVIVVDLAPTASSLRYLSFPDLMGGLLGKLARAERSLTRLLRPLVKTVGGLPLPEDRFYEALDVIAERLLRLRARLLDPAQTVARLVAIPERIVVDETVQARAALSLFGLAVDAVVMNRVLTGAMAEGPWAGWASVQAREVARARALLPDLAFCALPWQADEPCGAAALGVVGAALYDGADPAGPLRMVEALHTEREDADGAVVVVPVPGVRAGEVDVLGVDGGVVVTVGSWRRTLSLPPSRAPARPVRAVVRGGRLSIHLRHTKESP